mmetsp:Transcript_16756/g.25185  ORF Transcript_16756/g.25185 Transcript_16756/m.25185 type:complete len:772 (+) Transcript_16756:122-2437(+)|eukprot:CAMPEP_0194089158 /NCGR_PEP_ID=MMETSP0149-20130528/32965_1 /TAXON_ID=122233 /ORGANISM="Chaetoceros debilis, Strain MM31A-1" /LENGTH=771 /DNA_ID=CAMNT_0038772991 /DNA_START=70 /DNA_END=2385 /DNA_ORIENTATION=-
MSGNVAWKHIGLYANSVGTFTIDAKGIRWKSAMNTDDDDVILTKVLPASTLTGAKWTVFGKSGHLRIQTSGKESELRFDGFPQTDFDKLRKSLADKHNIDVVKHAMASAGASFGLTGLQKRHLVFKQCILDDAFEEGEEFEPRDGDEMLSMNLGDVSQCVVQGNTKHEVELQFHELDTVETGTDQLVGIRFYIPPDPDADPTDKEAQTPAEQLQQTITKVARIKNTAGNAIVEFDENKGTFLTPRGRYTLTLYDTYLRMHGTRYDYHIKYDDISRLFLLPKPDDVHYAFVIALDKPIRQGQQRYQMLVLQTNKQIDQVTVNLDEETLKKEYDNQMDPIMQGSLCNLIAKTFKIISKKKVFVPGKFENAYGKPCVKCALRASEGHLYPLEKSFVFIHKPPVLIRFDEVDSVEFQRYAGGQGSTRNFDLSVKLERQGGESSAKEYVFSGIDRSDFDSLYNFLSGKKIRIINTQDALQDVASGAAPRMDISMMDDDDDSEDDEDFGSNDGSGSSSEDMSDDAEGKMIPEDEDSDLEEARKRSKKSLSTVPTKKAKKSSSLKTKKSSSKSKPSSSKTEAAPTTKKKKKDPKAPKKGLSAYMFFNMEMRKKLKDENPSLSFGDLARMVSVKYKELTPDGKKKYEDMASVDKKRYTEEMANYSGGESNTEPKAKKKKKDPNAPKGSKSAYIFFNTDIRPKLKEEHPDFNFGQLGKLIGQRYKDLTADEKAKFEKMAENDKVRYAREMEIYRKKQKSKMAAKKEESEDDESSSGSDSD